MVRVLVIAKATSVRVRIRKILSCEKEFVILNCHPSGDWPRTIIRFMPNVIILACQLDGTASLALVDGIFLVQPEAKVLILSKNPRDEESFSVISRLVSVLPRNVQADVLTQTVEAASVGKVPRDNTTDVDTQAVCNGAKTVLSGREYEILALIAKGNTNKDIARLLDIGNETVKFHVSNTLRKLSARSRAHAVAIVCQKP